MTKIKDVIWFPSQLALVLGINQTDILDWIAKGKLKAEKKGSVTKISENALVEFLRENRECVGRIYCDDLTPFLNKARARIVRKVEE